jgi:hypothetical protein
MDTKLATNCNGLPRALRQPVALTPAETKQVAGGSPYIPIPPAYGSHIPSFTHVKIKHL